MNIFDSPDTRGFWVAVIICAAFLSACAVCYTIAQDNVATDCDRMQLFRDGNRVYTCELKK